MKASSEISAKDITYDVSVDSIDFGTIENPFPSQSRTFTVTTIIPLSATFLKDGGICTIRG